MKYRYCVHPLKLAAALVTVALCVFLAVVAAVAGGWLVAALFAAAAVAFGVVTVLYGSVLTLDETGLARSFCGIPMRRMAWAEVAEVGVVGLKVFNNNDPKRPGTRYLYFSPRALDKDARFKLALEWPPREALYMAYTKERARAVQALWSRPIETYNAGEDVFF